MTYRECSSDIQKYTRYKTSYINTGFKRGLVMLLAVYIAASITGCRAGSVSSGKINEKIPIKISDIEVCIEEEIHNGDREVMFCYTNNSGYTITYIKIRMRIKAGITKSDIEKFNYGYGYPDDWDVDFIFMDADSEEEVQPNETSKKTSVHRNNILYVRDIAEYEIMQPDIMTLKYLDGENNVHTMYYDYKAQKYSIDTEPVTSYSPAQIPPQIQTPTQIPPSVQPTEPEIPIESKLPTEPDKETPTTLPPKIEENEQTTTTTIDWKSFLREYEEWVDGYIELLERYAENPTDMSIMMDYIDSMQKLSEWGERAQTIQVDLANDREAQLEYMAMLTRILQRLAEVEIQ